MTATAAATASGWWRDEHGVIRSRPARCLQYSIGGAIGSALGSATRCGCAETYAWQAASVMAAIAAIALLAYHRYRLAAPLLVVQALTGPWFPFGIFVLLLLGWAVALLTLPRPTGAPPADHPLSKGLGRPYGPVAPSGADTGSSARQGARRSRLP